MKFTSVCFLTSFNASERRTFFRLSDTGLSGSWAFTESINSRPAKKNRQRNTFRRRCFIICGSFGCWLWLWQAYFVISCTVLGALSFIALQPGLQKLFFLLC